MKKILINIDCGEGFGIYKNPNEEKLIKNSDLINVACGFHAGDPDKMREVVGVAKKYGVLVGAHPSYLDLIGFGRRSMKLSFKEIENIIIYQIGALSGFLKTEGLILNHVKPHGALYNDSIKDEKIAEAIGSGVMAFDKRLKMIGLSNSKQVKIWKNMGLEVLNEVFIDREYNDDGTLLPRTNPNAVINDLIKIENRVKLLAKESKIISIYNKSLKVECDTICIHSDTPNSEKILNVVKNILF